MPSPGRGTNQRNGKSARNRAHRRRSVRIEVPLATATAASSPSLFPSTSGASPAGETIIALYARGTDHARDQGSCAETYGTDVSAEFISSVTEAVMAEVTAWRAAHCDLPLLPCSIHNEESKVARLMDLGGR
ncbi:MAG: transposase [Simplicispira sp.]|nr:transposase [Simplicispira sp.]